MGLLDAYDTFVGNKCQELTKQNSTFEKLTESTGLASITKGVEDFISKDIVESLSGSALLGMAEDLISETISKNVKKITQNILGQLPDKISNTLADLRANAFNMVFSTLTFKNDMVMYFASTIAQETVDAIRDKRRTLISLQQAVRKLNNALMVLAGSESFFADYLADLRAAILKLEDVDRQLFIVHSSFYATNVFPSSNFEAAKILLDQVIELIEPPASESSDAEKLEINFGFLKAAVELPDIGSQIAMLQSVPKLAKDMLGAYDMYAVKVLKVNTLLLGFQSAVQNLKEVTGGKFKDQILSNIEDSRKNLADTQKSMAKVCNGAEDAINGPIVEEYGNVINVNGIPTRNTREFEASPTEASARSLEWLMRTKSVRASLEAVNAEGLSNLNLSNELLKYYNQALTDLGKLDDLETQNAILHATDGREEPGEIEAPMITFAFQANQAIVDSALLTVKNKQFDEQVVVALGTQLTSRLQLSIDRDREIEKILVKYIKKSAPLLKSLKSLGDNVFKTLDTLGLDRASDFLKRGSFGDFFSMTGKTATYVGAAVTGLNAVQGLVGSQEERQCILSSINKIKVEDTSKKLASQRAVATNFVKQQKRNEDQCKELKNDKKRVEACASAIDIQDLKGNPLKSLQGLFRGVFGGDVYDSLDVTGLAKFGENSGKPSGLGGIVESSGSDTQGVFSSVTNATSYLADAEKAVNDAYASAKNSLLNANPDDEDEVADAKADEEYANSLEAEKDKAQKNLIKQQKKNLFKRYS